MSPRENSPHTPPLENVDSLLSHAVVGAKQDLGEPQPHGARALGVRALALVAQRAFTSTWRARVLDGPERDQEVALVVLRDGATAPVRERFARIAEELRAAGEGLLGVLRVRSVARSRDAYLAHLWTAPPPARPREAQLPTAVAAPRHGAIPESVLARRAPFVGIAGMLTVALALGGGFFLGGSDSSLRTAFDLFLMLGSAAAVWLLPGLPRRPAAARVALAGSCVALVAVVDPLAAVYGAAARHRLHGGRSEPRAAIDEIVRLGRDFRGVSLTGLNLSGIDLTGADLRGVDLSAADLSNARLWGAEIEGASFDGARLEGADLDHTSLAQAKVGAAKCDAATQLPAGWRCAGFHITR